MTSAEPFRTEGTLLPGSEMASDMAENRYELSYRNISLGTAHNIFRLFYDTGDVTPKKQPVRKVKRLNHTDEIFVIGLIIESPSMQLLE